MLWCAVAVPGTQQHKPQPPSFVRTATCNRFLTCSTKLACLTAGQMQAQDSCLFGYQGIDVLAGVLRYSSVVVVITWPHNLSTYTALQPGSHTMPAKSTQMYLPVQRHSSGHVAWQQWLSRSPMAGVGQTVQLYMLGRVQLTVLCHANLTLCRPLGQ